MRKLVFLLTVLFLPLLLTACNTMQGMGSDLQEGGRALDRAVR